MSLQVFSFESHEVRTVLDGTGEPWWVASDVCKVLAIGNVTNALRPLPAHWKGLHPIKTPGGTQELNVVSESGLYKLVMRSDKPNAQPFQDWICSEVLPAIRKTGQYAAPSLPAKDPLLAQIEALAEVRRLQLEHEDRLRAVEAKADAALAGATGDTGFMTLLGFCKLRRIPMVRAELARAGLMLRKKCDAAGIPRRTIHDEHYGEVNLWPVEMLEAWAGAGVK